MKDDPLKKCLIVAKFIMQKYKYLKLEMASANPASNERKIEATRSNRYNAEFFCINHGDQMVFLI